MQLRMKKLLNNFISLTVLQGLNYLLPLLTLPYLVRILGPEKFGVIVFAQSFIQILIIFTDYGFNLSATQQIALLKNQRDKINKIFNTVLFIKVTLMIVSILILFCCIILFQKFDDNHLVFIFSIGILLGSVLFPVWFFQGIEDMKFITIINLISKLVSTIGIFILVKRSDDFLLVPILNSIGFIIAGVLSLTIVKMKYKINFVWPKQKDIKNQFREGWHLFLSTAAINFYTVSNTFILGIFTNTTIVAYYSSAEKIINAATGLIGPLSQTLYPYISQLVKDSKTQAILFINKLVKIVGIITGVISILMFIFADKVVAIVLGPGLENSVSVLRILSILPLLIGLSNIFGIQTMLTFNFKKQFSNILISASIVNVILAFILVPVLKHIGTSISVLISETAVTLIMFLFLRKKGLLFNTRRKSNV